MFRFILIPVLTVLLTACADKPYRMEDFHTIRKFDAHVHVNNPDPAFVEQARADNFEILSINVDYPDFPPLERQTEIVRRFHAADPAHFHYAASFYMKGFERKGWADKINAALESEVKRGAVAVKVWKNIGMAERDTSGQLIFLDDRRLEPVAAKVAALGVPLIAHQGEPRNCWLPLEAMTTDNDREYFKTHPQYHMYLHPQMPSYEALMAARDHFVAKHQDLTFVGAHMASLEWSVDKAAEFLDNYPGSVMDLAARITQVQYQSVRDYEKVRDFFIRYQDRILYGTDLTFNPGDDPAQLKKDMHDYWLSDWRYLATGEMQHADDLRTDVKGLALPREVIDAIYRNNARRVFFAGK
jgi:predicted TIM-barrel fold metal-dependent hydrolase